MSTLQKTQQSDQLSAFKSVKIECSGHVGTVIILGPGPGNAMGPDFWAEFPQAVKALEADKEVRAIVVYGNGKHFTYGLDLPAMMPALNKPGKLLGAERLEFLQLCKQMQDAVCVVETCSKPVIAAVSGWCIGAGVDLISACDIRICSSDAKFSVREIKVAIVADLGSLQRLPYIIGEGHTRELALTGKDIDAARALRIGLVNDVYETQEALIDAANKLANEIAENSPLVAQGVKAVLNESRDLTVNEGLRHVAIWNSAFLHSTDLEEAIKAFMERRSPKF
jgi:enoyl-CoA hydratase